MMIYECLMLMLVLCKSSYARLTPEVLQATAAPMASGEQNAKLVVSSARPGMGKMGCLVAFLCHLLV